jgi:hypothetical protein
VRELRYTLLSDGSSDRRLIPVLTWALRACGVRCPIQPEWADLGRLRKPPKGLLQRIVASLELYPCDLLFVHRDAEKLPHVSRVAEILLAVETVSRRRVLSPTICVVPVRMQEAWLLIDEAAIRCASGNPSGRNSLDLPRVSELEAIVDPKSRLHSLLRDAASLGAHRRRKMNLSALTFRVAELIQSYEPLMALPAFALMEGKLKQVVRERHWAEE